MPVSPVDVEGGNAEEGVFDEIQCEEPESAEARPPEVLRDPGAPTQREVEEHNITHLPFRSWWQYCVSGKAQDRQHRMRKEDQMFKQVPEVVFDK